MKVAMNPVLGRLEVDWVTVVLSAMMNAVGVAITATTLAETVTAHVASMAALRRLHGNAVSQMVAAVSAACVAPSGSTEELTKSEEGSKLLSYEC